jgi:hypothetical protein
LVRGAVSIFGDNQGDERIVELGQSYAGLVTVPNPVSRLYGFYHTKAITSWPAYLIP